MMRMSDDDEGVFIYTYSLHMTDKLGKQTSSEKKNVRTQDVSLAQ
jgi:hypothetical protein